MKSFLILLFAVLFGQHIWAQDEKFEALFIYNFTKYIEWPSENQSSEFVITVFGNDDIIPELESISTRMSANTKPIVIKNSLPGPSREFVFRLTYNIGFEK